MMYHKIYFGKGSSDSNDYHCEGAVDIDINQPHSIMATAKMDQAWGIRMKLQGTEEEVLKALRSHHVVAVSNGSFQDQAGAEACTIESDTKLHWLLGSGQMPGAMADQSAYCSELFGL